MFNIKSLAVNETSEVHLRDSNDELLYADEKKEKPLTVTVYGPGSKAYAKAVSAQQNRMVERLKKKGKADLTAEEKMREQAEYLAACTVAFNNFDYEGLAGVEQFKAAYSDPTIGFIAEQVGKHIAEWGNFTPGSAKN